MSSLQVLAGTKPGLRGPALGTRCPSLSAYPLAQPDPSLRSLAREPSWPTSIAGPFPPSPRSQPHPIAASPAHLTFLPVC